MYTQNWEQELYDNTFEKIYSGLEKELEQGILDLVEVKASLDTMYSSEDELIHRAETKWIDHNATVAAYEAMRVRLEKMNK